MDVGSLAGNTSKYDIPVSHLEYSYIENCTDAKYLEKIIKVLRTGKEGKYPDLEGFAERKLQNLNPKSKVLWKETPIQKTTDLSASQQKEIFEDIDSWTDQMESGNHNDEKHVTNGDGADIATNGTDFPVRSSTVITSSQDSSKPKTSSNTEEKPPKRVKPRDYREWDKIDVDAELDKVDADEKKSTEAKKSNTPASPRSSSGLTRKIQSEGMSDKEKENRSEREKEKGNEAFRAGDYTEAEVYYTRSLSLVPSIAARNNRAQSYIKLKEWDKAISDTNEVLKVDKNNIKAYLRRGVAFQGKSLFIEAKRDLDKVLSIEPSNKRAKEVMSELEKALGEQKTKGRRMMIEESDESDDEETEGESDESQKVEETSTDGKHLSDSVQKPVIKTKTDSPQNGEVSENKVNVSTYETPEVSDIETSESRNNLNGVNSNYGADTKLEEQNSQANEEPMKTQETEEKVSTGEEVEKVEQPPAVEPAPPLPDEVVRLKDEGTQMFKAGRYAEAFELYNTAILRIEQDPRHSPNLSVLYNNRAACKLKTGDLKACVEDCSRALNLNPQALKPLLRRATAYEGLEKFRQAYVDYKQALLIDPSAEKAKQGSSRCQSALLSIDGPKWREKLPPMPSYQVPAVPIGTNSSSSTSLPSVPTNEPKNVKSLFNKDSIFEVQKNLGNDCVKKGDFQSAITCYTKCIEFCADRSVAYTNRALCYLRTNQAELALKDCIEANRLEPGNVKALFRQGQAYKMLKEFEKSEQRLRQVIQVDPHNSAAKRELQVVLKHREEENLKKKTAPRKKIVIEESSSEDSEDENTESPQAKATSPPECVPESKTQAKTSPKNVPEQPDISQKPGDISEDSNSKVEVEDSQRYKSAWEDLENQKNVKGAMPPGQTGSAKQEVKDDDTVNSEKTKIVKEKVKDNVVDSEKTRSNKQEGKGDDDVMKPGKTGNSLDDSSEPEKTESGDVKYNLKVPKASSKIRPTAQNTPKLTKASGFEFMSTWAVLKSPQDITPYLDLLLQLQPKQLPSVISNKLEGEMLPIIGKCAGHLAEQGKADVGLEYLQYLTKVPRFQMNTMFMSDKDKKELRTVFTKLKNLKDAGISAADVDAVYKQFGL